LASASVSGEQEAAAVVSGAGNGSVDLDRLLSTASDELARLDPGLPIQFAFRWRGLAFLAKVGGVDRGFRLVLDGDLGAIPYSAESRAGRESLLALVGGAQNGVPGHFRIQGWHRLRFTAGAEVEGRATSSAILGWTVRLLLQAAPWLELVGAHCVARPARRP
jgi:hypothetical protein